MRKSKKLLALLLLIGCAPVIGATLKIATVAPDGTTWMKEMRAAGEQVETETEGRVQIKFYPGGVMGNAPTVLRKMRIGQLQGGAFTSSELAGIYPDLFIYGIPFLFRGHAEADFVRARLDGELRAGLKQRGYTVLGLAGGGFAFLMSDREISSGGELANAKVWVPEGDTVSEVALRLAGVSPIPLPLSDVYTGLQTGLIDTVVNTPAGAIAFQWHTKVDYLTDIPVAYVLGLLVVDNKSFDRLASADQQVLVDTMGAALERLEAVNESDNAQAKQVLAKEGVAPIHPDSDEMDFWHRLADRTMDELASSSRLEFELLEETRRLLESYRSQAAED